MSTVVIWYRHGHARAHTESDDRTARGAGSRGDFDAGDLRVGWDNRAHATGAWGHRGRSRSRPPGSAASRWVPMAESNSSLSWLSLPGGAVRTSRAWAWFWV